MEKGYLGFLKNMTMVYSMVFTNNSIYSLNHNIDIGIGRGRKYAAMHRAIKTKKHGAKSTVKLSAWPIERRHVAKGQSPEEVVAE